MKTLKHTTVTSNLGKIVKPPAIFLLFGLMGFTFLAKAQENRVPKFQAEKARHLNSAWQHFKMGRAGHEDSLAISAFHFYHASGNCFKIVGRASAMGNGIPLIDFREMYICLGRVQGIREIVNATCRSKAVIWNANNHGKLANNFFNDLQNKRQPRGCTKQQVWKWAAEGYQQMIAEWNALN